MKERRFIGVLRLAASSKRDRAGWPAGRTYTNGASVWTTICSSNPSPLLNPIVPLLDLEPLQRAPADVGRLRILRHQPFISRSQYVLPRLQARGAQPPNGQDQPLPLQEMLEGLPAFSKASLALILAIELHQIEGHEHRRRGQIALWPPPEPLEA